VNILISGGFGFIGSYLTPYLLDKSVHVGVITRRVPQTFKDIAKKVDCHVHDLSEDGDVRVPRAYDCFVQLAGSLHSSPSTSPALVCRAVEVTRRCLEVCRINRIPRFIYFSTFQVYGRDHGFIDESTPVSCMNDYTRAHHLSEQQVRLAHREGELDYVILRPTNGYGFSSHTDVHRWSLVPSCFCSTAVAQGEIVLRTSGHQQKDFIHLEHVASLTHGICLSFDRFKNQTINLASGSSHAIVDVATLVKSVYERMVGRTCLLRVLSENPPPAEPLVVSRAKTADLPRAQAVEGSLTAEIVKTLSFLTRDHGSHQSV
jgi:UDP-glucose 4-epimerase